jgi:acyl carrier protein
MMESEQKLKNIISRLFGLEMDDIGDNSGSDNVQGWDSMGQILLIGEIERDFNVRLTPNEMSGINKLSAIKEVLRRHNVW